MVAVGTCATYGGIPAMKNNPTGAMGVPDYLGWSWKSKAGLPVVCIPGCPAQPDNMTETLLYLALHLAGLAPAPELDEALRPKWLFGRTVREGCNRAGFAEQGDFATEYGSDHRCLVKLGCKGPVVKCNVPVRGWVNGIGGCPNVGGICMACTMPGFPDKFMPFMDADRWGDAGVELQQVALRPDRAPLPQAQHRRTSTTRSPSGATRRAATGYSPTGYAAKRLVRSEQMATVESRQRAEGHGQGDVVGSDHPDRRAASGSTPRSTSPTSTVLKCYSTSMIFRGFDIFMKGIDPRDAHFITSRICGICGDNHCTCSCLNQNMAYGVKPPPLGDLAFNLAETADYIFDHAIFNDCMANVDFCEQMVKETNPDAAGEGGEDVGAAHRTSTATRRSPTSCGR